MPSFGPVELTLIMVIVVMLFGVGKLPEVFGAVGKGMKEFRRNATDLGGSETTTTSAPVQPVATVATPEINAQAQEVAAH